MEIISNMERFMPCRCGCGSLGWHERIKRCGRRITVGREAIVQALSETSDHLSAEDIYTRIHDKYPNVGLTTIYRTLDMLVNLGLVFKFDFGDGRARYELSEGLKGGQHHHHLVCTECKRVIDYADFIKDELNLLQQIEKALSEKYRFKINHHMIQFYGICQNCLGK
jgi:Fur family ferric uptake transcriptional regulator